MAANETVEQQSGVAGGAIASTGNLGRIAAVPWKNEGGQTRELCVEPPEAGFGDFVWRASVADVGRDGAFSTFDGIARTIVLLEGGGFTIHAGERQLHDLRECFAPFAFDGELQVSVRLHGAPTLDFNLMIRRELAEGEVVALTAQNSRRLSADTALLYVAQGAACLTDAAGLQLQLRTGEFVRLRQGAVPPDLLCAAGAVVLAVHIRHKK
ncbi:HutD family protein [Herbaspirillum sp. WKF16]|jgi:environmental stress-induced protein Ves|uniref:HutD/Ves family protein n=1 Tax=Herbaspirillum sp. WKF16 TaxID=3028312 RepID=UPI0023A9EAAD|nr:HutD family protein [Herbaspirillum sp. WKF16]WDZ98312.1 HutD family protein [Herbaspirillum sp. WKF16]